LSRRGQAWDVTQIQGVLGKSDMAGDMSFDTSQKTPLLTGKMRSKRLDFDDLRPVIGLPVKSVAAVTGTAKSSASPAQRAVPANTQRKVLPTATLDLVKLKAMNADVIYSALDIRHIEELPLDKGSVHVKLNNGVLRLEPLALGVAGGTLAG
jgi:uncharacterized protein involved in outer membrane biogenesis